jgi:hypothetical protein
VGLEGIEPSTSPLSGLTAVAASVLVRVRLSRFRETTVSQWSHDTGGAAGLQPSGATAGATGGVRVAECAVDGVCVRRRSLAVAESACTCQGRRLRRRRPPGLAGGTSGAILGRTAMTTDLLHSRRGVALLSGPRYRGGRHPSALLPRSAVPLLPRSTFAGFARRGPRGIFAMRDTCPRSFDNEA